MKTVLITGAGGNLGVAVVKRFLSDGYQVLALVSPGKIPKDITNGLHFFEVDLLLENEIETLIQTIAENYGTIDAALLLAGGFEPGGIDATDGAALKRMYSLNFETAYYVGREIFKRMMNQASGGRIVFIGARPALEAGAGKNLVAYGLSKSLLFKLSEYLNAAGAQNNVVTCVLVPSTIDTPSNRKAMPDADYSTWVTPMALADALLSVSRTDSPIGDHILKMYGSR